ncbi:glycosyltransferase family 4 protein [Thiohalobacter thiocyanaticus]|uniref:Glycosyltransferase family 4 protein n=1 Tax=Thiohalobacter thiocyanaticus TaxID=585455 RepID=A0A426QM57_9GAMM|nr:glycosyltransferase family 4 protein [Thiohalobacter thiocyanaticus]RRQ22841.1 glycosyltransferase family 4 protein [Thiohalobacter thiocyanaticus]
MKQARDKAVLVISELFLPTKGGTAVWFDEVYRRLGGKNIHILTARVPGGESHDVNHPNSIHRVNLSRHWWLRPESLAMYAGLLWRAFMITLRRPVATLHAGRVLPEGMVALLIGRLFGRPVVIYAHGEEITTWNTPLKQRVLRFVYRQADTVVANSRFTRDLLLVRGVAEERIRLIYPGVDTRRFRPGLEIGDLRRDIGAEGAKLILSVGRLTRRKGFDQIIQALPALLERGVEVHYALIGIGEDEDYLRRLAAEQGVSERVHLLGHVSPEDLPRWYNAADVFAMPNREIGGDTEGFGMVFIEAAACGTPAIAGQAGGTGSAVLDDETGLRIEGADLNQVIEALYRILGDEALARRLSRNALERVQREFAWEAVAEKTRPLL